jgi:SAM-dependent methyltransferase
MSNSIGAQGGVSSSTAAAAQAVDPELPYDAPFERTNRNASHTLVYELALARCPTGGAVLDVGCATGSLGAALRGHGLHVTGVEPLAAAAAIARTRLDEVFTGLSDDFLTQHADARFQAIIFADVLEHMPDPGAALRRAAHHLAPGGVIVVSVPNVTHASVRAMLLEGRWDMGAQGILDRTHLRFYSRSGFIDLCSENALAIDALCATAHSAASVDNAFGMKLGKRSIAWAEWLARDDTTDVFQHVAALVPAASADVATAANAPWRDGARQADRSGAKRQRPYWQRRLRAAWELLRASF